MTKDYDLVILGGGTGGYVAAIRASQLGLTVAIVEKSHLGGTCLHQGCIPSKALLRSAELYKDIKNASDFGIDVNAATLNFEKVQQRKENIINQLYAGVQQLMKKGKIDVYEGFGRLLGPSIFSPIAGTISIEHEDDKENTMLVPKNVLLATGSSPNTLPGLEIDGTQIISSEEALNLESLPQSITIVGGGVIGVEWASMLSDFGVNVTLIEYQPHLLAEMDESVSKEIEKALKTKGVNIYTNAEVLPESLEKTDDVNIDFKQNDEVKTVQAEKLLVSVGRVANINGMGLENTDIKIEKNSITVNDFYQTKESHIYAIGDCIGGMQLAHVASHEGIVAVEHMANQNPDPIDYQTVASCVYSYPEAAMVGLTEKQANEKGYQFKTGVFSFKANGKALVHGDTSGFAKIITDKKTDDVLGVHMVGPDVTNLISEVGLAKVLDASAAEIGATIHPHPTLSEVIGEAALAVDGKQIHG